MNPIIEREVSKENERFRIRLDAPLSTTPQYYWVAPKTEIMVFLLDGKVRAFNSICPHMGARLEIKRGEAHCPWHGLNFDLNSLSSAHSRYRRLCEYRADIDGQELVIWGKEP